MNSEVERRVGAFVDDLRASPAAADTLAVIVSGSAARGEERWLGDQLVSDIDVMVVSRSSPLRLDRSRAVEAVLAAHASANVEGGRVPASTLDYASLANFEARQRGVVVSGDPAVLERIPLSESAEIPAWEAVRLLANRLFEHLKHRAGMIGAGAATIKSYEAIGESQLVLERRYRPSFRERVAEMERQPLASPVADAQALYLGAERIRRGEAEELGVGPAQALDDLRLQLGSALGALGCGEGGLERQLATLARRERHLTQRVYWTLRGLSRRDGLHRPGIDPILQLWRAGLGTLSGTSPAYDPAPLVRLWQHCPQILRKG